jgi:phage gp36-like protein
VYVTLIQLAERPGALELAQLASPKHEAVGYAELLDLTLRGLARSDYSAAEIAAADAVLARITEAATEASARIDGYLRQRGYTLPLSPVPPIVAGWCRDITRYLLSGDRISDESSDPVLRGYRDAMKLLQQVAAGTFSLGANDAIAIGDRTILGVAPGRRFDAGGLSDY